MRKIFVVLVILFVCIGVLIGYVSSEGPGKVLEVIEGLLSGSNNGDSGKTEYITLDTGRRNEGEESEKEDKPLLREYDDLFDKLKLNDPDDMKKAADIMLDAADNYTTDWLDKKWIPEGRDEWFGIDTLEANADMLYAAYTFYLEQGGKEIPEISKKLEKIDQKLDIGFEQFNPVYYSYAGNEKSTVAVRMTYSWLIRRLQPAPVFTAVSIDRGETWDYRLVGDNCRGFTVSENGDFAFLSYYHETITGVYPQLTYFDRSNERTHYRYISIFPIYQYDSYVNIDILSITKGSENDLSDNYVMVGYRGAKEPEEEESYFLIVRYGDSEEDEDKETLFSDDDFIQKLRIIVQSECYLEVDYSGEQEVSKPDIDFVFPDSNDRYLKYEEILEWKRFAEEIHDRCGFNGSECYKAILRRAINEIYARKGYDFAGTSYTLFNNSEWYKAIPKRKIAEEDLNEYEKHNIDLLAAIEAENQ